MQVFDGHNGAHAAQFASDHLLEYLVADDGYPAKLRRALVRPRLVAILRARPAL